MYCRARMQEAQARFQEAHARVKQAKTQSKMVCLVATITLTLTIMVTFQGIQLWGCSSANVKVGLQTQLRGSVEMAQSTPAVTTTPSPMATPVANMNPDQIEEYIEMMKLLRAGVQSIATTATTAAPTTTFPRARALEWP